MSDKGIVSSLDKTTSIGYLKKWRSMLIVLSRTSISKPYIGKKILIF